MRPEPTVPDSALVHCHGPPGYVANGYLDVGTLSASKALMPN
jgi:hypothetical protein